MRDVKLKIILIFLLFYTYKAQQIKSNATSKFSTRSTQFPKTTKKEIKSSSETYTNGTDQTGKIEKDLTNKNFTRGILVGSNATTIDCQGILCGFLPGSSTLDSFTTSKTFLIVCFATSLIVIFFIIKLARMKRKRDNKRISLGRRKTRTANGNTDETRRLELDDDDDDDDDDWTLYDVTPHKQAHRQTR